MTLSDPWYRHLHIDPPQYPLRERIRAREALAIPRPSFCPGVSEKAENRKPSFREPRIPEARFRRRILLGCLVNRGRLCHCPKCNHLMKLGLDASALDSVCWHHAEGQEQKG